MTCFWNRPFDPNNAEDETPVTLRFYEDHKEATELKRRLEAYVNPNILKCKMLNFDFQKGAIITLERMPRCIEDFIKREDNLKCWKFNKTKTHVLCVGGPLLKIFKGIINGLKDYFQKNEYHGNLEGGVRISEENVVKLVDPVRKVDQREAMKQDLIAFHNLVLYLVNAKLPTQYHIPPMIKLFSLLCQKITGHLNTSPNEPQPLNFFDLAFLVLNNPLFYDADDRFRFIEKLLEMHSLSKFRLQDKLVLKTVPASLQDWHTRITLNYRLYPKFLTILTYGNQKLQGGSLVRAMYKDPYGIIIFYRNTFAHYSDRFYGGCDNETTENDLLEFFSDFLPKVYYEIACDVLFGDSTQIYLKDNFIHHMKKLRSSTVSLDLVQRMCHVSRCIWHGGAHKSISSSPIQHYLASLQLDCNGCLFGRSQLMPWSGTARALLVLIVYSWESPLTISLSKLDKRLS